MKSISQVSPTKMFQKRSRCNDRREDSVGECTGKLPFLGKWTLQNMAGFSGTEKKSKKKCNRIPLRISPVKVSLNRNRGPGLLMSRMSSRNDLATQKPPMQDPADFPCIFVAKGRCLRNNYITCWCRNCRRISIVHHRDASIYGHKGIGRPCRSYPRLNRNREGCPSSLSLPSSLQS